MATKGKWGNNDKKGERQDNENNRQREGKEAGRRGGGEVTETVVKGRIMRTSEIRMRRRGRSEENTEAGGMREERNRELERMRGRRGKRKRDWGNG